jgi:transposase InsO family protein
MQKRRKFERTCVQKSARILLENSLGVECVVLDLTNAGAGIQVSNLISLPAALDLTFDFGRSIRAFQVVDVLDQLVRSRGKPQSLRVDNGPEFAGRMLDQWAYLNGVEIDFSRPGKPTDNAFIEALNARVRAECLNASWFLSMADARDRIEEWRHQYEDRPHSALGNLTPNAFADQASEARKIA